MDGLLFLGIHPIAADVEKLRKQGLAIKTALAEIYDNQTRKVRSMMGYCSVNLSSRLRVELV